MQDTYFVSNTNKKANPFIAALIGVGLFFGSFVMIYKNEGTINLALFAEKATLITSGQIYGTGQLVALEGEAMTHQEVGDGLFKKPEKYIALKRDVLMYAWEEESKSQDNGTEYTYKTVRTNNPDDSSFFERQSGHENPQMPFKTEEYVSPKISIENISFDGYKLSLPSPDTEVVLSTTNTDLITKHGTPVIAEDGSEIYIKHSLLQNTGDGPNIGDLRISYHSIPIGSYMTVFGAYSVYGGQSTILPYVASQSLKNSTMFYHMRYGDKVSATLTLGNEYTFMLWLLRILGFVFMLTGLNMILSPIRTLLGYIPIVGQISNFALGLISFVTVLVLYSLTLFISIVLHSVIALAIASIGVIVLIGFISKKLLVKKQVNQSVAVTPPSPPVIITSPQIHP